LASNVANNSLFVVQFEISREKN